MILYNPYNYCPNESEEKNLEKMIYMEVRF